MRSLIDGAAGSSSLCRFPHFLRDPSPPPPPSAARARDAGRLPNDGDVAIQMTKRDRDDYDDDDGRRSKARRGRERRPPAGASGTIAITTAAARRSTAGAVGAEAAEDQDPPRTTWCLRIKNARKKMNELGGWDCSTWNFLGAGPTDGTPKRCDRGGHGRRKASMTATRRELSEQGAPAPSRCIIRRLPVIELHPYGM